MQVLVHAHEDGQVAGVWLPDGTSAYSPGEDKLRDRALNLMGAYATLPWDKKCARLASKSPYVDRYASLDATDGQSARQVLTSVSAELSG